MSQGIRRVVTGLDEQGHSTVLFDDRPAGHNSRVLWHSAALPADNRAREDTGNVLFNSAMLGPHASTFIVSEMSPAQTARPFYHSTDTLDYVVVLRGRIELQLETCSVELAAGDCVVDRGVNHAWRVLGDEPAMLAVAFLPAEPLHAEAAA